MSTRQKVVLRRATSAGYRLPLPDGPNRDLASTSSPSIGKPPKRYRGAGQAQGESALRKDLDAWDAVKEDEVWREFVRAELQRAKRWQENWSFLKDYDSMGKPKVQKTLPEYVPIYSDKIPNTMNQNFGRQINTPIGQKLILMDRLLTGSKQKKKLGNELQAC
ncbi:uncharacterized protein C2orf50 homolog [Protopterus annectens]|uniref:uncharacterized protein C2orf50 homolog n=1 Tax=Protopterus annectens TaxID=7888 RepID=UPI001CFBD6B3|nr:uncharacterized protein C2orf50 homolog [Protopterus annectens]